MAAVRGAEEAGCVLVTGGAGFIGAAFVRRLLSSPRGRRVIVLDKLDYCSNLSNLSPVSSSPLYRFVKGDICSADLLHHLLRTEGVDAVVHFAAQTHVDNSFGANAISFTETNVLGTHILLESCRAVLGDTLKRFVHVSTDEVYGESELHAEANGAHELDRLNPTNPYAATKAGAEYIVMSYYKTFGLPIIITRGNNVYGPRQYPEKLVPKFILRCLGGERMPIHGKGEQLRSFLYIDDVAKAYELILDRGEVGDVYNIGSLTERTIHSVAEDIYAACKSSEGPSVSPYIEYVEDRLFNDRRYFLDSSKLERLGWRPQVTWEEGLRLTVEWYRENMGYWGDISRALLPHPLPLTTTANGAASVLCSSTPTKNWRAAPFAPSSSDPEIKAKATSRQDTAALRVPLSFHKRHLPPPSVALSSPEGRRRFRDVLSERPAATMMELRLLEQLHTQAEPAFCGLGALATALNALDIDPGRIWKLPWRWIDESMLGCCVPLDVVKREGITLRQFCCLANCNGGKARLVHPQDGSLDSFREDVHSVFSGGDDEPAACIVVSYSRKSLNQTGDGHFSPLGAYHKESDSVLILDVTRFKYTPHWVPLKSIWEALSPIDAKTGQSRGYVIIERAEDHQFSTIFVMNLDTPANLDMLKRFLLEEAPHMVSQMRCGNFPNELPVYLPEIVKLRIPSSSSFIDPENWTRLEQYHQDIIDCLRSTEIYALVSNTYVDEDPSIAHKIPGLPSTSPLHEIGMKDMIAIMLLLATDYDSSPTKPCCTNPSQEEEFDVYKKSPLRNELDTLKRSVESLIHDFRTHPLCPVS